jgi:hypothetical protein
MIDNFALAISHGLILLAVWRLLRRPDLNDDAAPPAAAESRRTKLPWRKDRAGA